MPTKHTRREPRRHVRLPHLVAAIAAIVGGSLINAAAPDVAQSQISSHTVRPPFSSAVHTTPAKPALPKALVQVEMPPPPPTKIVPGMEEVLVATGPVTDAESQDLDAALKEFHNAPARAGEDGDFTDYSKPLLAFIAAHPTSNWNAALHANMGFGFFHAGYYSRAFSEFGQAWQLGRNATSPQAHILIDRAVGELAKMHARVGHGAELDTLFADIGTRPIAGPGAHLIESARAGLSAFRHDPGTSYLCGPKALKNVLIALKDSKKQIKIADDAKSGPHGFSLPQLAALASKTGLKYELIHREPGQPIPVPSIINWNVHHYAAIIGERDGVYFVNDPTFGFDGGSTAMRGKAIDAEGSGYFLVPDGVSAKYPKKGWRSVSAKSEEARAVYGMGSAPGVFQGSNTPCASQTQTGFPPVSSAPATETPQTCCGDCNNDSNHSSTTSTTSTAPMTPMTPITQMTVARATPATVSLHLEDTPVGYRPQIGVPNNETISYNSQEDLQPATFGFSNVSSLWSHSWQAYIEYDPTSASHSAQRITGGGGGFYWDGVFITSSGLYRPEFPDAAMVYRVPATGTPTSYTRNLPNGSKEVYGQSNGAASYPALLFLTQVIDAKGNTTTLSYDSSYRLTSVTDAMGRATTYTYGLSSYPLLITKITDPFGRTAQLTYDTSQRLSTITDPVGITSTFTYSTTEPTFVTQLTTPYGTSNFNDTPNPHDTPYPGTVRRSLTLTDPLGYTDYLTIFQSTTVIPGSDPSGTVPVMSGIQNALLEWRNTFYWNKHAWAACVAASGCSISSGVPQSEDFTKAALTHWYHRYYPTSTDMGSQISSVKRPLENRVWFTNYGSADIDWNGQLDVPDAAGRVLEDGSTQLSKATYPIFSSPAYILGPWPLTTTDPLGRVTQYTYASNNIDLLTVQQKTSSTGYTTIATLGSYNTQHEPQTYTGPDGQTWHYTYNSAGQISTITDPNSGVTTYNYDSTGRLSTVQNANLHTILTNTYDSADRIQTQTDSEGYTLTYAYDNIDRITSITYPDGTTDLYDYTFQSGAYIGTASLELRKYTDRLGRVTTYAYDADRRLTSVTEPVTSMTTRTTNYDYYEDGTLKDIIDANGNDTHWDIDLESRPIDKIYAYGTSSAQTETYTWETTNSRLHSITDALGQVKTFSYAKDDRITGITYTSTVNPTPNVTFAWDTYFPRMTSMTDGLGTTSYSYTAVGTNGGLKLSSIDGPYSNDVIGLTYDALGRLSGRNITGGNETFGYDAISRLTSHSTPLGSFTEGYLGQTDQMTSQSVTNGSVTVSTGWSYDTNTNDRRLIGISNSGVSRSYTLGYGSGPVNVYDIMSITDTAATGHPWATQSRAYTYDQIDRLLTASATTPGNDTYAYDPLDNPTTWNTPASGSLSPTFNGLNQLATFGSLSYSNDANGNTLSGDGVKTYKWDAENRLVEIDYVGTSNKTTFAYDGMGHRTVDAETVSGTTTTTRYLWCGNRICQTRNASDTVLRRDVTEGEYNVSTSQKLIYMPDPLGSVRDVIDATTGNLVQSYDYTPYGGVVRSNGSTPTDYQYAGLSAHPASGLNLSASRALDGNTGRWLNRDLLREGPDLNLYAYVEANPTNSVDPDGLATETECSRFGLCSNIQPNPPSTVGSCAEMCTASLFSSDEGGLSNTATAGQTISIIAATPIPKPILGVPTLPGASTITTVGSSIAMIGRKLPRLPSPILGSTNMCRVIARANEPVAIGTLIFDGAAIASCTASCTAEGLQ